MLFACSKRYCHKKREKKNAKYPFDIPPLYCHRPIDRVAFSERFITQWENCKDESYRLLRCDFFTDLFLTTSMGGRYKVDDTNRGPISGKIMEFQKAFSCQGKSWKLYFMMKFRKNLRKIGKSFVFEKWRRAWHPDNL